MASLPASRSSIRCLNSLAASKTSFYTSIKPLLFVSMPHQICRVEWLHAEGSLLTPTEGRISVANVTGPVCRHLLHLVALSSPHCVHTRLRTSSRASALHSTCSHVRRASRHVHATSTQSRRASSGRASLPAHARQHQASASWKSMRCSVSLAIVALDVHLMCLLHIVGGCDSHRMDLSSMVMLKDNHIWACGSITEAVKAARKSAGFATKIEVECDSEEAATEAIREPL